MMIKKVTTFKTGDHQQNKIVYKVLENRGRQ